MTKERFLILLLMNVNNFVTYFFENFQHIYINKGRVKK